jgi:hypothetical protein
MTLERDHRRGAGTLSTPEEPPSLFALFVDGRIVCGDASDADDSGRVELSDAIGLLLHLFTGGRPPPHPYPESGRDLTADRPTRPGEWPRDLGCSYETYYYRRFSECPADADPADCKSPWLQSIDLTPEYLKPTK